MKKEGKKGQFKSVFFVLKIKIKKKTLNLGPSIILHGRFNLSFQSLCRFNLLTPNTYTQSFKITLSAITNFR